MMEENLSVGFLENIQDSTVLIQDSFSSKNSCDNRKWTLLKDYYSKFILTKSFDQTVTASYLTILSKLLDSLKPDLFAEKWQEALFDEVFLHGIPHEAFLILTKQLRKEESYAQKKIIDLLQKFVRSSSLEAMIMYQCASTEHWDLKYVSLSNLWEDLISATVSLPERIANQTEGKFMKLFSPSCYIPLLLHSIFKVLARIHEKIRNSEDCSLEFLGKLIGRLCTTGSADIVAKMFAKEFIFKSASDFIWRRISQNLISKMPSNSQDSFIPNLLLTVTWYGYIEWLLGDDGVKNEKICYIMTVKLLFHRHFKQDIILQNIIGYYASSSSRVSSFISVLNSLLDSWTDESLLNYQNTEQKIYIASALMVCAGWVKHLKLEFDNKDYMNKILMGTQIRLSSSEEEVRSVGMIVGEHLLKAIDPTAPSLKFEFSNKVLLSRLKNLLDIPLKPDTDSLSFEDLKCFDEIEMESKAYTKPKNKDSSTSNERKDLDSDDEDLQPFDLSNDVSNEEARRPFYIRQCMKGLAEQKKPGWTEQCLKHAEELIKANPFATEEVAEEMAMILLHFNNSLAIPNCAELRHRILIALTVQCPILVANYLTSQFAEKDYNIRQRLDILEVLAASSALLSHSRLPPTGTSKEQSHVQIEADWKFIVNQRLEAKTKYYTKPQESVLVENKFSTLAGNFFFPLLNSYEKARKNLRLDTENSYVLGRFINTLGVIMCSASNTLHCSQMGTALLQFLATVHSHKDVFVRQAAIFAVAATYMAVPPSILYTEMISEVMLTNDWLQNVVLNDPEGNCIEKALLTLSICQSAAEEVSSLPGQLKGLKLSP